MKEEKKTESVDFRSVADSLVALHERKNADYGNSFSESWKAYEDNELDPFSCYALGRIMDKFRRIQSISLSSKLTNFESLEDSLADLASYCIMSIVELKK